MQAEHGRPRVRPGIGGAPRRLSGITQVKLQSQLHHTSQGAGGFFTPAPPPVAPLPQPERTFETQLGSFHFSVFNLSGSSSSRLE